MAWRRLGDKPLSEQIMDSLPTHICITRPQWVKLALVSVMTCVQRSLSHNLNQYWSSSLTLCGVTRSQWVNSLRPRQNRRHFADDVFKYNFLNENVWIPIKLSMKILPKGPINNIPTMVQIMAWRRPGDKPLSEPMMVSLPTHICVARPQWVKEMFLLWRSYLTSVENSPF